MEISRTGSSLNTITSLLVHGIYRGNVHGLRSVKVGRKEFVY
jgi:hypothetical protein